MNKDSEIWKQRFLAWLLDDTPFSPDPSDPSAASVNTSVSTSHTLEGEIPRSSGQKPFELGEQSVAHDRFYAVLKRRFRQELEDNLPLLPWETEVQDYPDELWNLHLQSLQLPIVVPDEVLDKIFQACQDRIQSIQQKGRQLVEAVESLFPQYPDQLNDLAGMMLLGAARDDRGDKTWVLGQSLPDSYQEASPQQQMALAVLAADQILFNLLTLELSPHTPEARCQWQTQTGFLKLQAVDQSEAEPTPLILLTVDLPQAGSVRVRTDNSWLRGDRDSAGNLSLHIPILADQLFYPLEVCLDDVAEPLHFSLRWTRDWD